MFSYLHGIRPNNRRSAIPQAPAPPQTTSSRYYHEGPISPLTFNFDPLTQASQPNSLNERSPVSPDPPILPPIPRVTSQHDLHAGNGKEAEERKEMATSTTARKPSSQQNPPVSPIPNTAYRPAMAVMHHPHGSSERLTADQPLTSLGQPPISAARRKRPIDLAYESMRSYSEPPQRVSFGTHPDRLQFHPQPSRQPPPPPPPPKSSQPQPQRQAPPPPVKIHEQVQPVASQNRHGKHKLNLLNPMSLLARRRSSQVVAEAYSQNQSTPGMQLRDDYDPRIRGKMVHDFSAPRPGRNVLTADTNVSIAKNGENKASSEPSNKRPPNTSFLDDESPSSTERDHTPLFKEHFDDSVEPWHDDLDSPAKRRSSAFMYQLSLQASQPGPDPSSLPAFARNLPQNVSSNTNSVPKTSSPPPTAPLEAVMESPLPNQKSAASSPPTSPPKARSRATSVTDPSFQTTGTPKRFTSNASRFSFDLAGVGSSTQEKLLEEKHRQKAKRKERESVLSDNEVDDDDGYADYDDMMDDEGVEEKIPGVNADADESDVHVTQAMQHLSFASPNKSSFESAASLVSTGLTSPGTPYDTMFQPMGLAISKSTPNLVQLRAVKSENQPKEATSRPKSTPVDANDPGFNTPSGQLEMPSETKLAGLPQRDVYEDDDMYFMDDEIIEDLDDREDQPFDESVFDDDTSRIYGLPLRDLRPLSEPQIPDKSVSSEIPERQMAPQNTVLHNDRNLAFSPHESSEDDAAMAEMRDCVADLNRPARSSFIHAAGLTCDNLGLHDRLALAANQAAVDGKFNRTYSQGSTHESCDDFDMSQDTLTHDNQISQNGEATLVSVAELESNDFAFDDAHVAFTDEEADDPIIAAANAEALENDDDGFYGQEFGFYARASGSNETEGSYGGCFGPRALEGVHRSFSGRDNFLEPSLTPITERSEWSNRNSAISLAMHGYPLTAHFQSNPQLTDLIHLQGDEMSLEALKKLRRGAWGGSDASLQSSSNSPNSGSPVTYLPPSMIAAPFMQPTNSTSNISSASNQNLAGSFHSFSSSSNHASSNESDPSPSGDGPTITLSPSQPGLMMAPMGPPPPPPIDTSPVSPVQRSAMPGKNAWDPGHKRNSSGAESVSYREEGGKWVCEKRRVDLGTGEVEVLGRSVVEGGRI